MGGAANPALGSGAGARRGDTAPHTGLPRGTGTFRRHAWPRGAEAGPWGVVLRCWVPAMVVLLGRVKLGQTFPVPSPWGKRVGG